MERRRTKPLILLVGPLPPPYIGPAVATSRLLRSDYLRAHFEIEFLDLSDPGGVDSIGHVNWHNVSLALRHAMRGVALLLRTRPDVMYIPIDRGFWGFLRDCALMLPARLLGVPVVAHLRAGRFDLVHDYGIRGRLLARIGLACTTRLLVLGESLRDVFGHFVMPDRVSVVPNGIDLQAWPVPHRGTASADGTFRIAYIGNLFADKGAHVMIEAMRRVREQLPGASVVFAGDWISADYRDRCLKMVEDLDLGSCVSFVGRIDEPEKQRLLALSDIMVFAPIRPEGLPWVVLEGMAAGLPVVGTPQGTMSDVIIDGETGSLVPSGDTNSLADAVIHLGANCHIAAAMGIAGRSRIENVYSEQITFARMARVLAGACRAELPIDEPLCGTTADHVAEGNVSASTADVWQNPNNTSGIYQASGAQ